METLSACVSCFLVALSSNCSNSWCGDTRSAPQSTSQISCTFDGFHAQSFPVALLRPDWQHVPVKYFSKFVQCDIERERRTAPPGLDNTKMQPSVSPLACSVTFSTKTGKIVIYPILEEKSTLYIDIYRLYEIKGMRNLTLAYRPGCAFGFIVRSPWLRLDG